MEQPHITQDPAVLGGKPVIAGTRISVEYVLELLEDGLSLDEIAREHPTVTREGVEAALAYARAAVRRVTDSNSAK